MKATPFSTHVSTVCISICLLENSSDAPRRTSNTACASDPGGNSCACGCGAGGSAATCDRALQEESGNARSFSILNVASSPGSAT